MKLVLRLSFVCLCVVLSVSSLTGCGSKEAAAVADQDEMQRYLDENSELKDTNSEEPNTQKEESPRTAPAPV